MTWSWHLRMYNVVLWLRWKIQIVCIFRIINVCWGMSVYLHLPHTFFLSGDTVIAIFVYNYCNYVRGCRLYRNYIRRYRLSISSKIITITNITIRARGAYLLGWKLMSKVCWYRRTYIRRRYRGWRQSVSSNVISLSFLEIDNGELGMCVAALDSANAAHPTLTPNELPPRPK